MGGERFPLPPPSSGKVITILSLDGGGVKGIIPAIILMQLEAELQKCKGSEDVRIADFFDVIAGTSTGGLITAMLTAPDESGRPLFTAAKIKEFYIQESPNIFSNTSEGEDDETVQDDEVMMKVSKEVGGPFFYPKYNGKYLHKTINEQLKETKLSQTVTKVVIPTFDMKEVRPSIFSSFKTTANPSLDAKLADICIGTSAAPTYFPPWYFQNTTSNDDQKVTDFNLIDGGIIANNPALLAISEVTQQQKKGNPDFSGYEINDYTKIFLVSFGTGFRKPTDKYDARRAASWGTVSWAAPLIEFVLDGSQDLVDYHLASVFQALYDKDHDIKNYLRIQTDQLSGNLTELDCATKENLDNLEKLANQLLNEPVKFMNLDTFKLEPIPDGPTNAEAIKRVAEFLVQERQARMEKFKATI